MHHALHVMRLHDACTARSALQPVCACICFNLKADLSCKAYECSHMQWTVIMQFIYKKLRPGDEACPLGELAIGGT